MKRPHFDCKLIHIASPSWIIEPNDVEGIVGNQVKITCTASGSPQPRIIWRKKGNFFYLWRLVKCIRLRNFYVKFSNFFKRNVFNF